MIQVLLSCWFGIQEAEALRPETDVPLNGVSLNLGNAALVTTGVYFLQNYIANALPVDATINRGFYLPLEVQYHRVLNPSFDFDVGVFYRYSSFLFLRSSHYVDLHAGGDWFPGGARTGFSLGARLGAAFWQASPTSFGSTTVGMRYDFLQYLITARMGGAYTWGLTNALQLRLGAGMLGSLPVAGTQFKFGYIFDTFNLFYYFVPDVVCALVVRF